MSARSSVIAGCRFRAAGAEAEAVPARAAASGRRSDASGSADQAAPNGGFPTSSAPSGGPS